MCLSLSFKRPVLQNSKSIEWHLMLNTLEIILTKKNEQKVNMNPINYEIINCPAINLTAKKSCLRINCTKC